MAYPSGARFGPYEIVALVGAGGMGEVYKARDTRIDRIVAIKVSEEHFSNRFGHEARAIAALNHPHICMLYDVGPNYLVMEFLEGTPLNGPLPLKQALEYAGQILEALDAAHRKGITHRDLKPTNILVTKQGIKLLDFGLAKQEGILQGADATVTALTAKGQIVGTLQYMAPEQLEGKEADPRSDLFSFGCVLYEMLTGRRAFEGQSAASVIAAILEREPASVHQTAPVERVLRRCLAKDPDQRFQNARDLNVALVWALHEPIVPKPSSRPWAICAAAIFVAALLTGWTIARLQTHEAPQIHSFLLAPPGSDFRCSGDDGGPAVLSPDGKRLAFAAATTDGRIMLWVRPLDSTTPQAIAGTEGAMFPFWSPNSHSLGFFADGKLKKVDATGGAVTVLADAPVSRGATWNGDDVILYSPRLTSPIVRTSASGGGITPVTKLDQQQQEISHRWPSFLPDGQHFLYTSRGRGVFVASLDPAVPPRRLVEESSNALYSGGFLLYSRESTLLARPFDISRMQFTGAPEALAQSVQSEFASDRACFTASDTGLLAYHSGLNEAQLVWFDRRGNRLGTVGSPGLLSGVELAPDGKQAAIILGDATGGSTVWIYETDRNIRRRFLSADSFNLSLVWSPDARRLAISERRNGIYVVSARDSSGIGGEELLFRSGFEVQLGSRTPNGGLTLITRNEKTGWDIDYLPPRDEGRDTAPVSVVHSGGDDMIAVISPDGRWVVYTHSEPGDVDLYPYIATFPGGEQRRQISTEAAGVIRWNPNGKEIFYASHNKLMAVDVQSTGGTIEVGAPHMLFQIRGDCNYMYTGSCFDVAPDGKRFLVTEYIGSPSPVALIQNWTVALKK